MVRQAPSYTWSAERVLDALRDWANFVGQAPRMYEWCPASTRSRGAESQSCRLWAEQHPRWPSATTVVGYHGSWRAALLAAGLPADRPPLESSVNERVDAAMRLHAVGMSQAAIAAELQLHPRTVRRYLRASLCGCGQGWVVKGTVCQACAQRLAVRRAPWTAAEVKRAIIEWARLEGAPPSTADWKQGRSARGRWKSEYPRWPSAHVAARLFGSWKAALEAAGFAGKPAAFSEQEVIAALIADADRLGRAPYVREWHRRPQQLPGVGAVIGHFGSWTDGLRAAGLRSPQEKNRWTQAATLHAVLIDAARRGRPPRADEWPRSTASHPSAAIAGRLFGSWNKMLSEAGLGTLRRGELTAEQLTRRGVEMTRALKAAQAELDAELARPAYELLARGRGWPSANAISQHFGSWPKACEAAGIQRHRWADITDDALLELLRNDAAELGRLPRKSEWAHSTAQRSSSAVIVCRFGSWTAALQAAGLRPPRFTQHPERSPRRPRVPTAEGG
jgi:hypothetical protein